MHANKYYTEQARRLRQLARSTSVSFFYEMSDILRAAAGQPRCHEMTSIPVSQPMPTENLHVSGFPGRPVPEEYSADFDGGDPVCSCTAEERRYGMGCV